jgi:hypothetical protein
MIKPLVNKPDMAVNSHLTLLNARLLNPSIIFINTFVPTSSASASGLSLLLVANVSNFSNKII